MMPRTVQFGSNDLTGSRKLYDATFVALGAGPSVTPPEYPMIVYNLPGGARLLRGSLRDGELATHANDGTVIFEAPDQEAVIPWHEADIAHGDTSEGAAETKLQDRSAFGVYLHDPDGNKITAYRGLNMG